MDSNSIAHANKTVQVKALYTIAGSGHLARLPGTVSVPVLGEVGLFNLKPVLEAVVNSSPELIREAKCDYNVYSVDFSEPDCPLSGRGMLSDLLASFARQSEITGDDALVFGRVCNNISFFGSQETLEVKLDFRPIDITNTRDTFRRNIETYQNYKTPPAVLSRASTYGQAPNTPVSDGPIAPQPYRPQQSSEALDAFHRRTSAPTPSDNDFYGSRSRHGSRPASPAMTCPISEAGPDDFTQPATFIDQQDTAGSPLVLEDQEFEEGPARKRARLTQANWRGRGSFGATTESLRVAVSTSASLRDFRPVQLPNASLNTELVPRAPTPRAAEKRAPLQRSALANSSLRRQSTPSAMLLTSPAKSDMTSPQFGPVDFDTVHSTPYSMHSEACPSSPPAFWLDQSRPSSRGAMSDTADDAAQQLPEEPSLPELSTEPVIEKDATTPESPLLSAQRQRIRTKNSQMQWITVHPGPLDQLPQKLDTTGNFSISNNKARSAVPGFKETQLSLNAAAASQARANSGPASKAAETSTPDITAESTNTSKPCVPNDSRVGKPAAAPVGVPQSSPGLPPVRRPAPLTKAAMTSPCMPPTKPLSLPTIPQYSLTPSLARTQSAPVALASSSLNEPDHVRRGSISSSQPTAGTGPATKSITVPPRTTTQGKRKIPLSQIWSPAPLSDAGYETDGSQAPEKNFKTPTTGSGVRHRKKIEQSLAEAISAGDIPKFCSNCGEIKPSTWRNYWYTEMQGDGSHIQLGSITGIHWVEQLNDPATDLPLNKCGIYKQWSHLTTEEKESGQYKQRIFCNACGDYIRKYKSQRPAMFWEEGEKKKRKTPCPVIRKSATKVKTPTPPRSPVCRPADQGQQQQHQQPQTAKTPSTPKSTRKQLPANHATVDLTEDKENQNPTPSALDADALNFDPFSLPDADPLNFDAFALPTLPNTSTHADYLFSEPPQATTSNELMPDFGSDIGTKTDMPVEFDGTIPELTPRTQRLIDRLVGEGFGEKMSTGMIDFGAA